VPALLQAFARLVALKRLGILLLILAATLCAASTASALEPTHTKTRVWGFDFAEHNSDGLFLPATSGKHQGNRVALSEVASGSLLAAEGAAVARAGALTAGRHAARGFAEGQLEKHFAKHAAEWGAGNIKKIGYLKRAQSLLGRDVGGNIIGAVRANGDVRRYNAATNEFVAGAADGTIRTIFRPSGGMGYWLQQVAP
jgi:hypothetical protein